MIWDIQATEVIKMRSISYLHLIFETGDEMYLTDQGVAVWRHLLPHNFWTDKDWFQTHSERQTGSGNVYNQGQAD